VTDRKYELLFVDDEPANLQKLRRTFVHQYGVHTAQSGEEALKTLAETNIDAVVTDQRMPGMTGLELLGRAREVNPSLVCIVLTGYAEVGDLVDAINTGKVHKYITKPWTPENLRVEVRDALEKRELRRENERLAGELEAANERLRTENTVLRREMESRDPRRIIYGSHEMEDILNLLRRVVGTETTVLVQGETGTGKELVARFIHDESSRRDQVFVPVNCGAIPRELVESEFFGHAKGAFTGAATEKKGYFEMADGGTILLDEIGEAPPELQVKLLRVIQEGEIMPVGRNQPKKVDVRVIASTNKDLESGIEAGSFREDLYYRLNVLPFHIPPLRERAEDVPLLAAHFLEDFSRRYGRKPPALTRRAKEALESYPWPGNVRELRNLAERVVILTKQPRIDVYDLPEPMLTRAATATEAAQDGQDGEMSLHAARERFEREFILRRLVECKGNICRAAEALQVERSNLYRKIKQLGIPHSGRENGGDEPF